MVDPEDIFVGICTEGANLLVHPTQGEEQMYWGYICCSGKLFSPKTEKQISYGEMCIKGDIVGVLLEFDSNHAQLTFYRNKKNLGLAFAEIPSGIYYPAVTMYYNGVQVSLNTNLAVPVTNNLFDT